MDCTPPGCPVHGTLHAIILEWVAISFSRESSHRGVKPACLMSPGLAGGPFTTSATWEAQRTYSLSEQSDCTEAMDCVDHDKLCKILKEMGNLTTWPASWEICMKVKKQQNWTWNNRLVQSWERSNVKAVYCQPVYLTSMQSTSCKYQAGCNQDC